MVSNWHAAVQLRVPPSKPWVSQVCSFRFAPSHCSPASIWPLPQSGPILVQPVVSNWQVEVQLRVPPSKPWVSHDCSFKFVPSHCSSPSISPLPQSGPILVQPVVSNWQITVQVSVPPSKPWVSQVCSFKLAPSHCSPASTTPLPQSAGASAHPLVSNLQSAVQLSVPPSKPLVTQVWEPSSVPSHCSPASITPLPHTASGSSSPPPQPSANNAPDNSSTGSSPFLSLPIIMTPPATAKLQTNGLALGTKPQTPTAQN